MNCDEARHLLSAHLADELGGPEKTRLQKHLQGCQDCSTVLAELKKTVALLKELPTVEPPQDFPAKVAEKIRKTPLTETRPSWFARLFLPWKVKLPLEAFALLLVAGLAVYLMKQTTGPVLTAPPQVALEKAPAPEKFEQTPAPEMKPAAPPVESSRDRLQEPKQSNDLNSKIQKESDIRGRAVVSSKPSDQPISEFRLVSEKPDQIVKSVRDLVAQMDGTLLPENEGGLSEKRMAPVVPKNKEEEVLLIRMPMKELDVFIEKLAAFGTLEPPPASKQDTKDKRDESSIVTFKLTIGAPPPALQEK